MFDHQERRARIDPSATFGSSASTLQSGRSTGGPATYCRATLGERGATRTRQQTNTGGQEVPRVPASPRQHRWHVGRWRNLIRIECAHDQVSWTRLILQLEKMGTPPELLNAELRPKCFALRPLCLYPRSATEKLRRHHWLLEFASSCAYPRGEDCSSAASIGLDGQRRQIRLERKL